MVGDLHKIIVFVGLLYSLSCISADIYLEQRLQQILSFKEHLKPASSAPQHRSDSRSLVARNTFKEIPDLKVAEDLARPLAVEGVKDENPHHGSVLAIGRALDVERLTSRKSSFTVLAMVHGEADHILRVVRPRVERWGWEKHDCELFVYQFMQSLTRLSCFGVITLIR